MLNKTFISKAECTTFFAVSSHTTPLPLGYHRDDDRMAADFFRLLVLVFRLFIVFLYCLSLLISPVIFSFYFFLLFCIPLVYLWYSLIPSRVLSSHPPLSPSSPPISFRHLHPSLQLCPLPETPSPPENPIPNRLVLGDFPPSIFSPPPQKKKNLPCKVTIFF